LQTVKHLKQNIVTTCLPVITGVIENVIFSLIGCLYIR